MSNSSGAGVVGAIVLALGLAAGGYFVGQGISSHGQGDRRVSVKGLSEREVPASVAIWTLSYTETGNDLAEINSKLAASTKAVTDFLLKAQFGEKDFSIQPPSVSDLSLAYRDKDAPPLPARYSASQSVLLRTSNVDLVKPAVSATSELMLNGVLLSGRNEPTYFFDKLNDIKPDMIQEATKNARIAATEFATDSQVNLGRLCNASQGRFQIDDRDSATPERKVVRVVVEVDYEVN